ncbi:MAG: hypothetical protein ACI9HA_002899 [Dinoroseobacter sp.]|jgi:hypothetical protein
MKYSVRLALIGLFLLCVTGCVKVDTSSRTPTLGAEIIDLSKAKELGKLSEQEYRELRRKVLASF